MSVLTIGIDPLACDQNDPGPWMAFFTGDKRRTQTDTPVPTTEQPP